MWVLPILVGNGVGRGGGRAVYPGLLASLGESTKPTDVWS